MKAIAFIFGESIEKFDDQKLAIQSDVIKRYMHRYDQLRGSSARLDSAAKSSIITEISEELINVWHSLSREVASIQYVKKIVKKIVDEATKLQYHQSRRKNDTKWISEQLERFDGICNISPEKKRVPFEK